MLLASCLATSLKRSLPQASSASVAPWIGTVGGLQMRGVLTIRKTPPLPEKKKEPKHHDSKSLQEAAHRLKEAEQELDEHRDDDRDEHEDPPMYMRLARRIAMAGICSRREAEDRIRKKRVRVNGELETEVSRFVNMHSDEVRVDGHAIPLSDTLRVWIAHKLPGELVTTNDPEGRPTIFDRLSQMGFTHHIIPVGRLDFNTEGLLVLTNNGEYARQLEHPSYEVPRVYKALVRGDVSESKLADLARGPTIDGIKYRPIKASIRSQDKKDTWLMIKITEGKNREIRKALSYVRLVLKRLIRVQYGPYRLADLPAGSILETSVKHIRVPKGGENKKA